MTDEEKQFILAAIDAVQFSGSVGNAEQVMQILKLAETCKDKISSFDENP